MDFSYKGKTPVQAKQKILILNILDEWAEATVFCTLAAQFIAATSKRDSLRFYLYSDKGTTWKEIDDDK